MSKWAPGPRSAPATELLPASAASSLPWGIYTSINLRSRHRLLSVLLVQSREDASPCRCPGQQTVTSAAPSQHSLKRSSPPDPSPELSHEPPNPALLPHSLLLGPEDMHSKSGTEGSRQSLQHRSAPAPPVTPLTPVPVSTFPPHPHCPTTTRHKAQSSLISHRLQVMSLTLLYISIPFYMWQPGP